jgi:hypothetical protein
VVELDGGDDIGFSDILDITFVAEALSELPSGSSGFSFDHLSSPLHSPSLEVSLSAPLSQRACKTVGSGHDIAVHEVRIRLKGVGMVVGLVSAEGAQVAGAVADDTGSDSDDGTSKWTHNNCLEAGMTGRL